jgi:rhodanese-related sulfurtransferase
MIAMPTTAKEFVAQAEAIARSLGPNEAKEMMQGDNVVIVDVRDAHEITENGKLKNALNVSRGMLEFCADPATPYHKPELIPESILLIYCASGKRAVLAAKTLRDMGFNNAHAIGGLKDLVEAGCESVSG